MAAWPQTLPAAPVWWIDDREKRGAYAIENHGAAWLGTLKPALRSKTNPIGWGTSDLGWHWLVLACANFPVRCFRMLFQVIVQGSLKGLFSKHRTMNLNR